MGLKFSNFKTRFRDDIYYLSGLLPNEIQKKIENRISWYNRKKAVYKSSLFEMVGGFCSVGLLFILKRFSDSEPDPMIYGGIFGGLYLVSLEGIARFLLSRESIPREPIRYLNRYDKIEADVNEFVAVKETGYYSIDVYDSDLKIGNFILDVKKDSYYRLFVDEDYDDIGIKRLTLHLTNWYKDNTFGSLLFGVPYHCFNEVYSSIKKMTDKRKINFKNLEELVKKEPIGKS